MSIGQDCIPELITALAERAEELATHLVGAPPTSRHRGEARFRARGSLSVMTGRGDRVRFFDHEAGVGGDGLRLIAHLRRCATRDAIQWATTWLGGNAAAALPPRSARPSPSAPKKDTTPLARALWAEAVPAAGTLAETYLASRGLALPADAPLRFHPRCPRGAEGERLPAMLALMTDPITAEPLGVHRTFLAADGSGKAPGEAKKMLGAAGLVRLVPDEDVSAGLGVAEGIETALSVAQHAGWRPVWACCSSGAIATLPVLPGIEALTVFADADDKTGAGLRAARACAARWANVGVEVTVRIPPAGTDWHDATRQGRAA